MCSFMQPQYIYTYKSETLITMRFCVQHFKDYVIKIGYFMLTSRRNREKKETGNNVRAEHLFRFPKSVL